MADMNAIVEEVVRKIQAQQSTAGKAAEAPPVTVDDYPVMQKHPDWVKTPQGRPVSSIDLDAVANGEVQNSDLRISRDMLLTQALVAEDVGKPQVAENLRRAAELTAVPDDLVIKMYDSLRPNRSTRAQLDALAQRLTGEFNAPLCAKLVQEAAEIYEKRGVLLREEPDAK